MKKEKKCEDEMQDIHWAETFQVIVCPGVTEAELWLQTAQVIVSVEGVAVMTNTPVEPHPMMPVVLTVGVNRKVFTAVTPGKLVAVGAAQVLAAIAAVPVLTCTLGKFPVISMFQLLLFFGSTKKVPRCV